jgi:hypothetical protein
MELVRQTNAAFADRMLHLDALQGARNPEAKSSLARVQAEVTGSPVLAYEVGRWMLRQGIAGEALSWIRTLPQPTQTNHPLPILIADCHAAAQDWPGLLAELDLRGWGELEYLRLLQRARALRGQGLRKAAEAEWAKALRAAEARLDRLSALFRNAAAWNWEQEQEEALWGVVTRYPGEKWARQALHARLQAAGQTRSLLRLSSLALEADPSDLDAKNNFAVAALLLDLEEERSHAMAEAVYRAEPTNASYASTYALSLHLRQRDKEALRLFEELKPETLETPSVAPYYGLVLRAAGKDESAKKYLDLGSSANLLPEEKRLLRNGPLRF